jgi:hypothetical protein
MGPSSVVMASSSVVMASSSVVMASSSEVMASSSVIPSVVEGQPRSRTLSGGPSTTLGVTK